MCAKCYEAWRRDTKLADKCVHKDRKAFRKGLCSGCYKSDLQDRNEKRPHEVKGKKLAAESTISKSRKIVTEKKETKPTGCMCNSPGLPLYRSGQCYICYARENLKE